MSAKLAFAGIFVAALFGLPSGGQAAAWIPFADPESGMRISVPQDLFPDMSETEDGFEFVGPDARLELSARADLGVETPQELRDVMMQTEGYADLTYSPGGRTWLVASGYREGEIYYEKFFVRDGRVHAFSIQYPEAMRQIYDPVVERLEDSFRPW